MAPPNRTLGLRPHSPPPTRSGCRDPRLLWRSASGPRRTAAPTFGSSSADGGGHPAHVRARHRSPTHLVTRRQACRFLQHSERHAETLVEARHRNGERRGGFLWTVPVWPVTGRRTGATSYSRLPAGIPGVWIMPAGSGEAIPRNPVQLIQERFPAIQGSYSPNSEMDRICVQRIRKIRGLSPPPASSHGTRRPAGRPSGSGRTAKGCCALIVRYSLGSGNSQNGQNSIIPILPDPHTPQLEDDRRSLSQRPGVPFEIL
jgi:hypothetical protein